MSISNLTTVSVPCQVVWNSTMLQSEDVGKAVLSALQNEKPIFSKL